MHRACTSRLRARADDSSHGTPRPANVHSLAHVLLQTLEGVEGGLMTHKLYDGFIGALSACPAARQRSESGQCAPLTGARFAPAEKENARERLYIIRLLLTWLPPENLKCLRCAERRVQCRVRFDSLSALCSFLPIAGWCFWLRCY